MVACSSTEKVVSSSSRGSSVSRNQTTVRNIGKFQVDSNSYVATGKMKESNLLLFTILQQIMQVLLRN